MADDVTLSKALLLEKTGFGKFAGEPGKTQRIAISISLHTQGSDRSSTNGHGGDKTTFNEFHLAKKNLPRILSSVWFSNPAN